MVDMCSGGSSYTDRKGYDQFQQVTNDCPEFEKWGVFVFVGLVWVYFTARPGVLIGAIDAYVLGPAQKVFDNLSGRRNLKTSDFLIGDKLGEGSFGVVYFGCRGSEEYDGGGEV
ncbi:putative non-specific serine/threonine protein kinase [Helianthus anomalus]